MSVIHPQSEASARTHIDASGSPPSATTFGGKHFGMSTLGIRKSRLIYPALMVLVTIGLSTAGLSGSSIGVLRTTLLHGKTDPALVVGTPRPIRSDEWNVDTPLLVAQSHHGYPRFTMDGIGDHDLSVIPDIPNTDWSTAFKPWGLPALALDVEHGFAARWWLISLFLLLGAYLLLLALTDRTDIAIVFSLGLWLSPFFQWWYSPGTLDSVGMALLALGAFVYSLRASSTPRRVAWLALTAYSTISFVLVFYPPFQIPTALVVVIVGLCYVIGRWRELGITWRRLVLDLGAIALVVGFTLGAYYIHSRSTIVAIDSTVYPGHRRVSGGGTSLLQLLSAPFGLALAQRGLSLNFTNQSEISSFVLLGPFALLQMQRLHIRGFTHRWRLLLVGTAGVFLLLAMWYLISLPPVLAALLLLDRVEPERAIVGLGLAGILVMALFCAAELEHRDLSPATQDHQHSRVPTVNRRLRSGALACSGIAFVMYFWAGRGLRSADPSLDLSLWEVGIMSAAVAVAVFLTCARKVILGGVVLVILSATISLPANPLYQGLGPLTSSPLLATFASDGARQRVDSHVWVSFDADPAVNDVLIASGVPTLNAVDTYPVAETWRILDPTHRFADIWNRYANVYFAPGAIGSPPSFHLPQPGAMIVTIDPCGAAAGQLGIGFVVSSTPLNYPCLRLTKPVNNPGGLPYIYFRT